MIKIGKRKISTHWKWYLQFYIYIHHNFATATKGVKYKGIHKKRRRWNLRRNNSFSSIEKGKRHKMIPKKNLSKGRKEVGGEKEKESVSWMVVERKGKGWRSYGQVWETRDWCCAWNLVVAWRSAWFIVSALLSTYASRVLEPALISVTFIATTWNNKNHLKEVSLFSNCKWSGRVTTTHEYTRVRASCPEQFPFFIFC